MVVGFFGGVLLEKIKRLPGVIHLRRFLFEKKFSSHRNVNYFRGIFDSFDEALKSAPKTKPLGYDNRQAAEMYQERLLDIYSTDYPVLFWLEKNRDNIKTVFDFGGHIGIHYYTYQNYLDFDELSAWIVCDVPAVLNQGIKIAKEKNEKIIGFEEEVVKADGIDLFLANGSLQYLDWELHEKISNLKHKPKFVIVNMTPLHKGISSITLQSIGTSFCPYYIRKEEEFTSGLLSIGYKLVDRWVNEEKSCNIAFNGERSLDYYLGMCFELQ